MRAKKWGAGMIRACSLCLLLVCTGGFLSAQTPWEGGYVIQYSPRFMAGINLYREGRWLEAAAELRAAQETASNRREWVEALYWVALAEFAAADYGSALRDMDTLERAAPENGRSTDIVYHRARAYYCLGYYDEAIPLFKRYADEAGAGGESRKAAALYWIGECLYAMGQLETAAEVFGLVTGQYPGSVKYEAATYRLDLIKQKKIEGELLSMLKWSHEESLKTVEEYQRREKTYDQALNAYQKRLADIMKDSRQGDLESSNAEYQRQLAAARDRIQYLEGQISGSGPGGLPSDELKVRAQQLRNEVQWDITNLESGGGTR